MILLFHFSEKRVVIDDYKKIEGHGVKIRELEDLIFHKGHLEGLELLHENLTSRGKEFPKELWDIFQITQVEYFGG